MSDKNYKMVATTMSGLEEVLREELNRLGAQNIKILNRAVEFFGDLGFMYKGVFPKNFDNALLKLNPNEIGEVVKTPFGFHVVQLLETKPADIAPFKDVEQPILKHLITLEGQKKLTEYTESLKKDSRIEILYDF